jgi:hypothetical protein
MADTCREWMRLARWLHERGITSLTACTGAEWRAYAAWRIKNGVSRDHARKTLGHLTVLWGFDQLTARPSGIARPPWESEGIDGYLPAADGAAGGENMTEPLDPQVIGPLLIWAILVVEDFSGDILAAWAENRRLTALADRTAGSPEGRTALEAYLLPLIASGSPLPAVRHKGATLLARNYIAAAVGASPSQLDRLGMHHGLTALAAQRPGPCPLDVPVTGQVNGRPWRQYMDFDEAPELMRHLGTAAAITCLYLTGMRPQEVQGLRSGCCPDPEPGPCGTTGRHLIRSRHYKNVTNADGNHLSAGEDREAPWVAIAPVVRAIRVLPFRCCRQRGGGGARGRVELVFLRLGQRRARLREQPVPRAGRRHMLQCGGHGLLRRLGDHGAPYGGEAGLAEPAKDSQPQVTPLPGVPGKRSGDLRSFRGQPGRRTPAPAGPVPGVSRQQPRVAPPFQLSR